jgi:hypothetical protein
MPCELRRHEPHRQKIIVAAKRLDDVVTDLPERIAVKIDVQVLTNIGG